jgi:taurine dioxygenase
MVLAYQELPTEIKDTIEGLNAVHDMWPSFGYRIKPDNRVRERAKNPPIEHPIVLIHPLSQERILYVNPGFVTHICNFRNKYPRSMCTEYKIGASRLLLYLFEQSQIPEYQMRLHWEVDTVVVWDNLATQHYAISDYFPAIRQMRRLTIKGGDLTV